MAVYKIFPEKDATLYSQYPAMNSGIDEIIEATTAEAADGSPTVSRFLVQFPQNEILDIINNGWDIMIAHPPCTHLAVSGARWFKDKIEEQKLAIEFVLTLSKAPINKICIENPIGVLSSKWRKPDQIIQPWQFGHGETKATCLWLKNLSKLSP